LDVLFAFTGTRAYRRAAEVAGLAHRHLLPSMYGYSEFIGAGGLMSYGPNLADLYRRAASYVHRILKGARPGDLAVERPSLIDLEINLASAKALGIKVPQTILLRAVRVIE
jgi:putative ABC transport system substrate-binding protein